MKRIVEKLSEVVVRRDYPLSGGPVGWYFRVREVSNGVFLVEGTDLWGRRVSREGTDDETLLALCAEDARAIDSQRDGSGA